jgi:hypothetical protein
MVGHHRHSLGISHSGVRIITSRRRERAFFLHATSHVRCTCRPNHPFWAAFVEGSEPIEAYDAKCGPFQTVSLFAKKIVYLNILKHKNEIISFL